MKMDRQGETWNTAVLPSDQTRGQRAVYAELAGGERTIRPGTAAGHFGTGGAL